LHPAGSYRFQKEAFASFLPLLSYQHNDGIPFPESGIASGNYLLISLKPVKMIIWKTRGDSFI